MTVLELINQLNKMPMSLEVRFTSLTIGTESIKTVYVETWDKDSNDPYQVVVISD